MRKILHADDVERFRDLVRLEFESDYEVISLEDCDHVLEEAARQNPDAVILDHLMPSEAGDTGFDICQQLREKHAGLPIVVFTGAWDGAPDKPDLDQLWGAKVVSKQDGTEALREAVEQLLAGG